MLKVLIAEDEILISDMIQEILVDNGYEVCGMARTVAEAVVLGLGHRPDLAVIDIRLANGDLGTKVPKQLTTLGRLGVLYTSGNVSQVVLTAMDGDACLAKPYRVEDLLRALDIVAEIVATGTATPPFPRGFQLLKPTALARAPERCK